jgi:hypothetical protein
MVQLIDDSHVPGLPPECERVQDDLAVLAVGALDGLEGCRLLRHVAGCPRCEASLEEYALTARALETVVSIGIESSGLSRRIMDSIRLSGTS